MSGTSLWELQVALVARLKGFAGLTTLVAQRIYDGTAPTGAVLPYVVIGDGDGDPVGSTFGRPGTQDTTTCHVWSGYAGRKEALAIVHQMDLALAQPLILGDWGAATLKPDFRAVLVEEDGVRHAPVRYRMFAIKAA